MPRFRPLQTDALAGRPVSPEVVPPLLTDLLSPSHFYLAPGVDLVAAGGPEETAWEVFQGRLLDPAHTRRRRAFLSWNLFRHESGVPSGEPLLSVKWDRQEGVLSVVRGLEVYAWEGYDAGGGVILSRERRKWTRELVGAVRLDDFADAEELRDELTALLFLAVAGTARLPLHSLEAPLPDFSFGRLLYCRRPDPPAGPMRSWRDLFGVDHGGLHPRERLRWLETLLHAVPPDELPEAAAALSAALPDVPELLRGLFRDVSLSPWTGLSDRVLALLRELEARGSWTAAEVIDFLGGLLRGLGRHLTAYDLVTFHHRGANYPDALLLDAVLSDYLDRIERRPDLFRPAEAAGRLRRRALRQGWLARRRYEGHPVPDVPTSPGENGRVWPNGQPHLPEEQILQPAHRRRRLFAYDPLAARLGPHAAAALRQSVLDLAEDAELRELGLAVFLDRPFGVGKGPAEPDATPLLASVAFSHTLAGARLDELARDPSTGLDGPSRDAARDRLRDAAFAVGVALDRVGPAVKPGTVALADARLVAGDFRFLHTDRRSLLELAAAFGLGPPEERFGFRLVLERRLVAREPNGPGVLVYDEAWRPRLRLEIPPGGFVSRAGVEYPAAGVRVEAVEGE